MIEFDNLTKHLVASFLFLELNIHFFEYLGCATWICRELQTSSLAAIHNP